MHGMADNVMDTDRNQFVLCRSSMHPITGPCFQYHTICSIPRNSPEFRNLMRLIQRRIPSMDRMHDHCIHGSPLKNIRSGILRMRKPGSDSNAADTIVQLPEIHDIRVSPK